MIYVWVWTVSQCEGGNIAAIVARAKTLGVGLIVKTHDGATAYPNGYLGFRLIEECQKAGVPVRAWGYWWPWIDAGLQADFAMQAGVDYIADAEGEYDGQRAAAAAMVDALLARRRPGQLLGCAPLPIVSYHDQAGQYEEWNRLDVICPQAYAGTGGRAAVSVLDWTEAEFARFQKINLEPCVYAADQPAGELRAAIAAVRARVQAFGADGDLSIWSYQHMTDAHWSVVAEFAHGGMGMVTLGDYITVDPKTGLSLEDLVKGTTRLIGAVELLPQIEADIKGKLAAANDANVELTAQDVVDIVTTSFTATAGRLAPAAPFAGGILVGASSYAHDATELAWYDPATKMVRHFKEGVELATPSA